MTRAFYIMLTHKTGAPNYLLHITYFARHGTILDMVFKTFSTSQRGGIFSSGCRTNSSAPKVRYKLFTCEKINLLIELTHYLSDRYDKFLGFPI